MLLTLLENCRAFGEILAALEKESRPVLVSGLDDALKTLFPAAIIRRKETPAILFFPKEEEARDAAARLETVFPDVYFYPAREYSLLPLLSQSPDFAHLRLTALSALLKNKPCVITTSFEAALQATVPPGVLSEHSATLSVGDEIRPDALFERLLSCGYAPVDRVEGKGLCARRGDLVEFFSPTEDAPFRVEFFGDEIDAISVFDPTTQRRVETRKTAALSPAAELFLTEGNRLLALEAVREELARVPAKKEARRLFLADLADRLEARLGFPTDLFLPLVYPFCDLLSYAGGATAFYFEPEQGKAQCDAAFSILSEELTALAADSKCFLPPDQTRLLAPVSELFSDAETRRGVIFDSFFAGRSVIAPSGIIPVHARQAAVSFAGEERLAEQVAQLKESGYSVIFLCENSLEEKTLSEFFREKGFPVRFPEKGVLPAPQKESLLFLHRGEPGTALVSRSFELFDDKIALLCTGDGAKVRKAPRRRAEKRDPKSVILSAADLAIGDLVVHRTHGIGRYEGVEKLKGADGTKKDFIKIAYAGSDALYVPCTNLDAVSKYIGPHSDSDSIRLSKLGGAEWKKAKAKAKSGARDIAKRLLAVYSARLHTPGFAFSPDTAWQKEFEDAFPYGETDAQLRATQEIKEDMERAVPMDRLLCGDVGFGKTEVALRGVFKCVMDGKQAAILVPTTILAWQHYQTVLSRFKGYPVTVEMLSRFNTKKEQERTLAKLMLGKVDIVIGTHRLLQKDVHFADLGFLVVDEEQRFGVVHKERLKELAAGVDVLTLTATPIPRTLNMALGGIKDVSLLEEAPGDRFPVQTFVLPYDTAILTEAIRKELRRGGQVFYLHNNVEQLQSRAARFAELFPDAAIAVAHGKMDRESLSGVWRDMMEKRLDILFCTTIIESGVDLPDANTLIIENADRFGLSQLHQIRGRVGRSDRRAYAYLTYHPGKLLSEIAVKRLQAIREYTEFGSGFRIAMRDLELRGAGDLLGAEQSGHLDSVGYELFMQLLEEAVAEEKGEKRPERHDCVVDLNIDAYLPETLVPDSSSRLDLYRKIAAIASPEEALDVREEMTERFGALPPPAENLFAVTALRRQAESVLCVKIRETEREIVMDFLPGKEDALLLMQAVYASALQIKFADSPRLFLKKDAKTSVLRLLSDFFGHLTAFDNTTRKDTPT